MSYEHTPLLTSAVCGLAVGMATACGGGQQEESSPTHTGAPKKEPQKLGTFFGVMVPTILSMFSIVLFLRTGECSAGLILKSSSIKDTPETQGCYVKR